MKKLVPILIILLITVFTTVDAQQDQTMDNTERTEVVLSELPREVRTALDNNYRSWNVITAHRVVETNGGEQYGSRGNVPVRNNDDDQRGDRLGQTHNDINRGGGRTGQTNTGQTPEGNEQQTNNRNDNRPDNPSYESREGTGARGNTQQETAQPQTSEGTIGNADDYDRGLDRDVMEENVYYEVVLSKGTEVITVEFDSNGNEI